MKFKICAALLLIFISNQVIAQKDTLLITPENGLLKGELIQAYTNRWKVTYIDSVGNRTPNKIWTDYGQIIELDNEKHFHRVQDLYDPNMNHLDTWTNMVKQKNLSPVSSSTLKPNGLFSFVKYNGTTAKLRTNTASKDSTVVETQRDYGRAVYDWSLYGMLLVGLPFEEGLISKMPIVGTNDLAWLHTHVVGKESITSPNKKKIQTWKVETNQRLVFWISETAPYVIRLELELPRGSKLLWEMY